MHPGDEHAITVFLADDHAVVRDGLRQLLTAAGGFRVVGEAATGPDALSGITELAPQLSVMDVRMPQIDGIEVIRILRGRGSRTGFLVLTAFSDERSLDLSIAAGAGGYLAKGCSTQKLVESCRRIGRGELLLHPAGSGATRASLQWLPDDERFRDLTPQEGRILAFVAEGRTNGEIARELRLAEKTVRNYVSTIMAKLGLRNRTQAAVCVAQSRIRRSTGRTPSPTVAS